MNKSLPPYLDNSKLPESLQVFEFAELESTNSYLKENKHLITMPSLCFTNKQTGGYGRFSRSWLASDKDLTFSLALPINFAINELIGLSELVALEIQQELMKYELQVKVKWPNDVLINAAKLGGILIEVLSSTDNSTWLVIGIGINLSGKEVNTDYSSSFIKLKDKKELLYPLVERLIVLSKTYTPNSWNNNLTLWQEADFIPLGTEIKIKQQDIVFIGKYLGLDETASLLLETDDSKEVLKFVSGDVSLRVME